MVSCFAGVRAESSRKLSLGFGYPYFSLKYNINPKSAFEIRTAYDTGFFMLGARYSNCFRKSGKFEFLAGGELDSVTYDSSRINAGGYLGYGFIEGEYFFAKKTSFVLDFGPVVSALSDTSDSSVSVFDLDFLINAGFYWYF